MPCDRDHPRVIEEAVAGLPESQADPGRHVCARCAYEKGFEDGRLQAEREFQRRTEGPGRRALS